MKIIGIIGGVSWNSSVEYYRVINETVMSKLGAEHSAEILMYSLDFAPVARLEIQEEWDELAAVIVNAVGRLERAGADFVLMASNTLHAVAHKVERSIKVPLLHIADATAEEINRQENRTVGLLGTRFVMEREFYIERLSRHGINVVLPDRSDREYVHSLIFKELTVGRLSEESRKEVLRIIDELAKGGAEAVVLACTELPLLIRASDTPIRLFDTMAIHAAKAVEWALRR